MFLKLKGSLKLILPLIT